MLQMPLGDTLFRRCMTRVNDHRVAANTSAQKHGERKRCGQEVEVRHRLIAYEKEILQAGVGGQATSKINRPRVAHLVVFLQAHVIAANCVGQKNRNAIPIFFPIFFQPQHFVNDL